jgi:hypothetical protein
MTARTELAARPVPRGEEPCGLCGALVWFGRIDPAQRERFGYRSGWITLRAYDGWPDGDLRLNKAGFVVAVPRGEGNLQKHNCAGRRVTCKYCGQEIRVIDQPPSSAETLAVVDPAPDPRGTVVLSRYGYAVYDPARRISRRRFRWHTKHERT